MKKLLPLIIALTLIQNVGFCLNENDNSDINTKYTTHSLFLLNSFQEGIAYFKNGKVSEGMFNYNVVYDKICYIRDNKIYEITNTNDLDSVKINKIKFYCTKDKNYEIIKSGEIKILLQRKANLNTSERTGTYGTRSNNAVVGDRKNIYYEDIQGGRFVNIDSDSDSESEIPVTEKYYFLVKDNLFSAKKMKTLKNFSDHKTEIKEFLKKNNIDFNNTTDLIKLTSYLKNLI